MCVCVCVCVCVCERERERVAKCNRNDHVKGMIRSDMTYHLQFRMFSVNKNIVQCKQNNHNTM